MNPPSARYDATSLHIPPELRGCIARFCDRQSLGRLTSVDRLWAAEAEPLLYHSVHLSFLRDHSERDICGFGDSIARVPRRASWVRRLLVEYNAIRTSSELVQAVKGVLASTPNLIDLRIRGRDIHFRTQLLQTLASPGCRFRLLTLYLSYGPLLRMPLLLQNVLRVHGASLRVMALNIEDSHHMWQAARIHIGHQPEDRLLHEDCAQFAFTWNARSIALAVHAATVSDIAAVAKSLADDPCAALSSTPVETLQLDGPRPSDEAPSPARAELSRALHAHFPLMRRIEVLIPTEIHTVDINAVVEAVAPFSQLLSALHVVGYRPRIAAPQHHLTSLQRKAWVDRLVEAGCSCLREVKFPDNSVAERTDAGWLDSVTAAIL